MDANEKTLNLFTTRVRQMLLQYKELRQENNDLYQMVDERDKEIALLKAQLTQSQTDYQSLKTDGDMESAQKRLAKLIRNVNKCITLLSEK